MKAKGGQQKIRWLDNTTDSVNMNLSKLWETVKEKEAWCAGPWVAESDTAK